MKGSKGDGAKHNQMKGASTAGETGPLFPRLHVNETEKAGPRAPPRNKMALYEQFTVPSHRFVQPSQTSATTLYQQQQYGSSEYRYPYLSFYMPSSVPYGNGNHGIHSYAKSSYGLSSGGTSSGSAVVNYEKSQRVPSSQTVEKSASSGVSRVASKGGGGSSLRSIPEQKAKDAADLYVPTLSSHRVHDKESQKVIYTLPGGPQKHLNNFDFVKSVAGMERPSITDNLQETLSTMETGLECPVSESQSCGPPRVEKSAEANGSTYVTDAGQPKRANRQSAGEALDEQNEGSSLLSPGQSCQQSVSSDAGCQPESRVVCQGLPSHVSGTAEIETCSGYGASGECTIMTGEEQSSSPSGNLPVNNSQSTFTNEENPGTSYLHKDIQKSCSTDREKEDADSGRFSADNLVKNRGERSGESNNHQNGNSEVSEPSQRGTGKGGGSDDSVLSVLVSVSMSTIRPKDVIRAVGQQQFWKARKALLRQQRTFSDQVFELHKLMKVQQLLAETPGTLIDDEMHFGATEGCDAAAPHCNLTERAYYTGDKAHNTGSCFKEGSKGQSLKAEAQPGITSCNPGWPQAVGKDGVGSNPSMAAFSPGGVSAWGYPSLGVGQWMGPMAAQGRPFVYQPFPGTFTPGSSFGGPYGSEMLGSISPMVPFGIPYCNERHQLLAEMRSNHGPEAASNHQEDPTVGHSPSYMPNDLSGSWCFMQYNHLNYNQRLHAAGSGKDVPTKSGASVNNQRPATVHSMKTSCVPGIQYQWGTNSHTGPSNTNGLDSSVHRSENSSPSIATRLNCNAFASTPSTPKKSGCSHQDEEGLAQHLDLAGAYRSRNVNHCAYSRRSMGGEESDMRARRWSKSQKEGGQVSVSSGLLEEKTYVDHSPDYAGNALDLFPLVPSLSPDGWSDARPTRQAEEWQGRVIKAVPRPAVAASQSAAGILLSLQRERQK